MPWSARRAGAAHTREDYPCPIPNSGKVNLVQRIDAEGRYTLEPEPLLEMPAELKELFEEDSH